MSRITAPEPTRGAAPSHAPPDVHYAPGRNLAKALGWFSIGLGVVELLAPRRLGAYTGAHHPSILQAYGVREIVTGIGILSSKRPTWWMWGRVAGDVVDLATLGEAMVNHRSDERQRAALAALAVAGVTALDLAAATGLTAAQRMEG